jgi:flagellar basal-body rod protein FlgC
MDRLSAISGSALEAYGIRQAVTANNLANVSTDDFKASRTVLQEQKSGGVSATVVKGTDTVDISKEAVDMMGTLSAFKANLATLRTKDEMTKELFKLKT